MPNQDTKSEAREYPQREILRRDHRYVQCQVMTNWTGSHNVPKYIACNDLTGGGQFIAHQAMGTWMEVDIIFFVQQINDNQKRLDRISKIMRGSEIDTLVTATGRLNGAIDIAEGKI